MSVHDKKVLFGHWDIMYEILGYLRANDGLRFVSLFLSMIRRYLHSLKSSPSQRRQIIPKQKTKCVSRLENRIVHP